MNVRIQQLKQWAENYPALIILGMAAAGWVIVSPYGDFPLNDDWAYTSPVRHLLEDSRLILSDWSSPLALPHILTGFVLVKLLGFSHTVLRLGTWLWGTLGAYVLFKLLTNSGVRPGLRWLCTFLFFFHPISFVLTFTFHTDVTFVALTLIALYFFNRARPNHRATDEWLGSFFSLAAILTRQIGLLLPIGVTVWSLLHHRRLRWNQLLRVWTVPLLGTACFYYWYINVHGPTLAQVSYLAQGTLTHMRTGWPFFSETMRRTLDSLLYTSLFGAPLLFLKSSVKRSPSLVKDVLWIAVGIGLGYYVYHRGLLPYFENVLHPRGLGTLTVSGGHRWKPALLWDRVWLWTILTGGAAVALWIALRRLFQKNETSSDLFLPFMGLLLALATLPGARYFDRYLLQWHVAWILFFALRKRETRVACTAWVFCLGWAAASLAGTRDYFAWNRAKWDLGREAVRSGFRPDEISNGFDWNAHYKYERNMALLKKQKPLNDIGEWEWDTLDPVRAVVSYSPDLLPPEHRWLQTTYISPLSPRGATIFLFGKEKHPMDENPTTPAPRLVDFPSSGL